MAGYKPKIDRKIEVVKVQRPVAQGGDPNAYSPPPILVYDERRRHSVNLHWADLPKWLALALETSPKLFARAVWTGTGWDFVGVKQAAWQSW
jgi:hypothetical protein